MLIFHTPKGRCDHHHLWPTKEKLELSKVCNLPVTWLQLQKGGVLPHLCIPNNHVLIREFKDRGWPGTSWLHQQTQELRIANVRLLKGQQAACFGREIRSGHLHCQPGLCRQRQRLSKKDSVWRTAEEQPREEAKPTFLRYF